MAKKKVETNTEILTNGKLEGLNYKSENVVDLLNNKALQSDLRAYIKTETDGEKAAWKLVRLLGKMAGEIKQDFGSDYAFAEFMGMSQSVVNKRKRLAEFAIELEKAGYTDTKGFELLPLIKKLEKLDSHERKLEVFRQILDFLSPQMTQKELREAVKQIDVEVDNESPVKIEQKELDTNDREESAKDDNEESVNNTEDENEVYSCEDGQMIDITLPVWVNSPNGDNLYFKLVDYQVSSEIMKNIIYAIEDIFAEAEVK